MRIFLLFLFFILPFACSIAAQPVDSIMQQSNDDSLLAADSALLLKYSSTVSGKSLLLEENKKTENDIQQYHVPGHNAAVIFLLVMLLGVITYLKIAFSKDLEDLLQAIVNRNISQQIFRTQSKETSFSSVVLHINFIIVITLYVQFILIKYFNVLSLENFYAILILFFFIFTFFYLSKIIVVRFIGVLFETQNECDEYIFNLTIACKTLGLALLPALFIFYTAPVRFFNFVLIITIFIAAALIGIFIWRGLSTAYKLCTQVCIIFLFTFVL